MQFFYYNDQVYFKAIDVALMLDYNDTTQSIRKNVDIEDRFIFSEPIGGASGRRPTYWFTIRK